MVRYVHRSGPVRGRERSNHDQPPRRPLFVPPARPAARRAVGAKKQAPRPRRAGPASAGHAHGHRRLPPVHRRPGRSAAHIRISGAPLPRKCAALTTPTQGFPRPMRPVLQCEGRASPIAGTVGLDRGDTQEPGQAGTARESVEASNARRQWKHTPCETLGPRFAMSAPHHAQRTVGRLSVSIGWSLRSTCETSPSDMLADSVAEASIPSRGNPNRDIARNRRGRVHINHRTAHHELRPMGEATPAPSLDPDNRRQVTG